VEVPLLRRRSSLSGHRLLPRGRRRADENRRNLILHQPRRSALVFPLHDNPALSSDTLLPLLSESKTPQFFSPKKCGLSNFGAVKVFFPGGRVYISGGKIRAN